MLLRVFSDFHALLGVQVQNRDGCSSDWREPDDHGSLEGKVLRPHLFSRIEQRDHRATLRINARQIRAFFQVASLAGQCEIHQGVVSAVLLGADMIDVVGDIGLFFRESAVFTPLMSAITDQAAEACFH